MLRERGSRFGVSLFASVSLLVSLMVGPGEAASVPGLRSVSDERLRLYQGRNAPGAAVVVMDQGRILFEKGYGAADIEHQTPVTPDTVFHVASLTKAFTAYAIARLEAEGKLSRGDPVRRYVPELAAYADAITLDHLIHHTSGIRDHIGLSSLAGWRPDDTVDTADVKRLLFRQQAGQFTPGSAYDYSNSNYFLLALIIERVTGRPYGAYLQDVIFTPAGMASTNIKATPNQLIRGSAKSYLLDPDGTYRREFLQFGYYGDTNLMTSMRDLGRWADFVMTTKLGGRPAHEALADQVRLTGGELNAYAWGFEVHAINGVKALRHGGSDAAFRAHMLLLPERRQAVLVASNSDRVSMSGLADGLAARLVGAERPTEKAARSAPSKAGLEAAVSKFSGTYRLENGLVFSLGRQEGRPRLDVYGLNSFEPEFTPPNIFRVPSAGSEVIFHEGRPIRAEVKMAGAVLNGTRVDETAATPPAGLKDMIFHCPELIATLREGRSAGGPALRSALGDPIEILPLDAESFVLKTWGSGVGALKSDAAGRPVALELKTFRGGRFACPVRMEGPR